MLYAITVYTEREWYINDEPSNLDIGDIIEIQADGQELELIREVCENIPDVPGKAVMNWYGDHAKFIAKAIGAVKPKKGIQC